MAGSKPIKTWIRKKIKAVHKEYIIDVHKVYQYKKASIDDEYVTYFPYQEDSASYVISSTKEELSLCEQNLPIPPQNLWLGYGRNEKEYLSGKRQINLMLEILKDSGFDIGKFNRILDFGCGAARMLRWLYPYANTSEIWGTDISSDHIVWANNYLKPPFNFVTNTTIPILPFENRYFNLIYAGSVFTHIDDIAEAWLLELRRILNPEGRLYITIQDKHSILLLKNSKYYKNIWLTKYLEENPFFIENKDNFDKIVCMRGTRSQVFYDIDYFCSSVKNIFDVISVNKEAYGFQTGILLKRK